MKKGIIIMLITAISGLIFSFTVSLTALAGQWMANEKGYWYQHSDGSYPVYSWEWIDGDGDGIYQCYAFDENGYLYVNTTTPDGFYVGPDGAWYADSMPVSRFFYHNAYVSPTPISGAQSESEPEYSYASDGTQLVTGKYSSPKSEANKKNSANKNSSKSSSSKSSSKSSSNTKTSTNVPSSEIVTSKLVVGTPGGSSSDAGGTASAKTSPGSEPDLDNTSYDSDGPGGNIPSNYSSQTVKPTTDESTIDVAGPKSSSTRERDGYEDDNQDDDDD